MTRIETIRTTELTKAAANFADWALSRNWCVSTKRFGQTCVLMTNDCSLTISFGYEGIEVMTTGVSGDIGAIHDLAVAMLEIYDQADRCWGSATEIADRQQEEIEFRASLHG